MDINTRALQAGLRETLTDINAQIQELFKMADDMQTLPSRIRDEHGNFVYTPLLVAKAQCLHALSIIQTKER